MGISYKFQSTGDFTEMQTMTEDLQSSVCVECMWRRSCKAMRPRLKSTAQPSKHQSSLITCLIWLSTVKKLDQVCLSVCLSVGLQGYLTIVFISWMYPSFLIIHCYCFMYFSALYVLLCTYGLLFCIYYYYCCCTVCTAVLFSYPAIFIAASVRNKLIHSFIQEKNE